jgi:ketosteroid isomerase-like protein
MRPKQPHLCIAKTTIVFWRNCSISGCNGEVRHFGPGVDGDARLGAIAVLKSSFQDQIKMTEHSLWRFSRALHRAINERQPADLEALLDEEVDWAIYGPIDMYPFFGQRRGKAAVMEVIRQIADNFRVHRFDRESIMLGVDTAASMMRYSLTALDSNKPISLRIAHFAQFRAGRLTNLRVLVDTFDLVEQTVGYPIHLPRMAV